MQSQDQHLGPHTPLLCQLLNFPDQTRLQMVKKELSRPGCDCLEMLLPDILKSRILSTVVSVCSCFISSLEIIKTISVISCRRGRCGCCQLCLEQTSECPEELSLALLPTLKMS